MSVVSIPIPYVCICTSVPNNVDSKHITYLFFNCSQKIYTYMKLNQTQKVFFITLYRCFSLYVQSVDRNPKVQTCASYSW